MLAVLQEALATFRRGLNSSVPMDRREFLDVDDWIRSRDFDWPFSFESICSELRIDPDHVHAGLAAVKRKAFVSRTTARGRQVRRESLWGRGAWKGQIGQHDLRRPVQSARVERTD